MTEPEVSIFPPSPSIPLANSEPLTVVIEFLSFISDHKTILPPAPLAVALAEIIVASSTLT